LHFTSREYYNGVQLPLTHIEYSALITPDVPMVFFVLCSVFFSLKFLDQGKTKDLVFALMYSGCSIAIKYNSALTILIPTLAVVLQNIKDKQQTKIYWIPMLVAIPLVTFVMCMPYAYIDMVGFLRGLGSELRHYKVYGHGLSTSEPGIPHIIYQLKAFRDNLGTTALVIALIGMGSIFKKPKLIFVLFLPVLYFLYMTQMKVNFHRNFILIYPFIAILYASAAWVTYEIANKLITRFFNKRYSTLPFVLPLIIVSLAVNTSYQAMTNSLNVKHEQDPRSLIASILNETQGVDKIYIASELRFHNDDLKKINNYEVKTLSELLSCPAKTHDGVMLIPSGLISMYKSKEDMEKINILDSKIKGIDPNKIVMRVGPPNNALFLDIYSIHPEVLMVRVNTANFCP
jgi:hypothetical protein